MLRHLSAEEGDRYHRHVMSPAELLNADDHLAACEACRQRLSDQAQLQSAFSLLRAGLETIANRRRRHLSYEQLAAYIDNESDDVSREIVENHLATCRRCAAEMRDILAFQAFIATDSFTD